MDDRPSVLTLFCGAGGSAEGYHQAGFKVVGVDIAPQPYFRFDFIQGDAVEVAMDIGKDFDFIDTSCPCQKHSALTKGTNQGRIYLDHIPRTRDALLKLGKPFLMENVAGAPIRKDLMLCGEMFGLRVIRHRYFELHGVSVKQFPHLDHIDRVAGWRHGEHYDGYYVAVYGDGGGKGTLKDWQDAMEMPWVPERKGIAEAIPPAYTRYIGRYVRESLLTRG